MRVIPNDLAHWLTGLGLVVITLCHASAVGGQPASKPRLPYVKFEVPANQLRSVGTYSFACGVVEPVTGRTILVDRDSLLAIQISAAGSVVARTSLLGKGPGEIESCAYAGWLGRKLWISDIRLRRVAFVDPESLEGTSRLVGIRAARGDGPPYVRAVIANDEVLVELSEPRDTSATGALRLPLVRRSMDVRNWKGDTLTNIETHHRSLVLAADGRTTWFGFQPWTDDPVVRVSPRSDLFVRVDRRVARSPKRSSVLVTAYDMNGQQLAKWSYFYEPLLLDSSTVRDVIGAQAKRVKWHPNLQDSAVAHQWFAKRVFRPKYLPGIAEVMVARDSTIWLRHSDRYGNSAGQALWTRHSLQGSEIAALLLPSSFYPLDADTQSISGVHFIADWIVKSVASYRF